MELELKHVVPYLPYGLDVVRPDGKTKFTIVGVVNDLLLVFENGSGKYCSIRGVKPILRPISSITAKEATDFGNILLGEYEMEDRSVGVGSIQIGDTITPVIQFIDSDGDSITVFFGKSGIACDEGVSFEAYEWLFKQHFDIFYLIDKGLAIDKNTL